MADTTTGMTMAVPAQTLMPTTHTTTTKKHTIRAINNLPGIPTSPKTIRGQVLRLHTNGHQHTAHQPETPLNLHRQNLRGHRTTLILQGGGTTRTTSTMMLPESKLGVLLLPRLHHHHSILHLDRDPTRTPLGSILLLYRRRIPKLRLSRSRSLTA